MPINLEKLLETTKAVALSSPGVGGRKGTTFRLAATLFDKKGKIISSGVNSYKTHPRLAPFTSFPFIHAEQACILRVGLDFCEGLNLMVVRVKGDDSLGLAKPCVVCRGLIRNVGIKGVWFTNEQGGLVKDIDL
jgi:tRNA(Arg) A34 adenosine deaminase TadA